MTRKHLKVLTIAVCFFGSLVTAITSWIVFSLTVESEPNLPSVTGMVLGIFSSIALVVSTTELIGYFNEWVKESPDKGVFKSQESPVREVI